MINTMLAVVPPPTIGAKEVFTSSGERIRTHRKALFFTVTAAAQAAAERALLERLRDTVGKGHLLV